MPGTFSFSSNFEEADVVAQTDFTVGNGPGIDNTTQFSTQGADFHFDGNDISVVAVALYAGQTLHLDVDYGQGGIQPFNSKLWLIDTTGALQAANSSPGTTDIGSTSILDPRLDFTASKTGVYFIAVSQVNNHYVDGTFGFDGNGTAGGDFLLNMSFSTLPAHFHGTDGNDSLILGTNERLFDARAGNDVIYAADVNSRINGGDGNDYIDAYYNNHNDILTGGAGEDSLYGEAGRDVLAGGAGNDTMYGGNGNDQLFGGAGNDDMSGGDGADILTGSTGDDRMYGGPGSDTIYGGKGNDYLYGDGGKDFLSGGPGTDYAGYNDATSAVTVDLRITGFQNTNGAGSNKLADIENLSGSDYADLLIGNAANNDLEGQNGSDTLRGLAGNDSLYGGYDSSADLLIGGAGNDYLSVSGTSRDTLKGDGGSDDLFGGDGKDILSGGGGEDYLYGQGGADKLTGGKGSDQFRFDNAVDSAPGSADNITDFHHGQGDRINLDYVYSGTLAFIGSAAFTGAPGEVRVHALISGAQAVDVNLDSNPNSVEMHIVVHSSTTLVAGDFIL